MFFKTIDKSLGKFKSHWILFEKVYNFLFFIPYILLSFAIMLQSWSWNCDQKPKYNAYNILIYFIKKAISELEFIDSHKPKTEIECLFIFLIIKWIVCDPMCTVLCVCTFMRCKKWFINIGGFWIFCNTIFTGVFKFFQCRVD